MPQPYFITFEGGEGAGKTTHINYIASILQHNSIPYIVTREPGGTAIGEDIRALLVQERDSTLHHDTEILLFFAARIEHVKQVILPALQNNIWVLCDRYIDSTMAYQAFGRGRDIDIIRDMHQKFCHNLMPDVTFWLDIEPAIGLARSRGEEKSEARFEHMDISFHHKVHDGFSQLYHADNTRITRIDASESLSIIQKKLYNILQDML